MMPEAAALERLSSEATVRHGSRWSLSLVLLAAGLVLSTTAHAREDLRSSVARMAKIGSCYSPAFSPDGSRIAFVSDLNGIPQVWTVAIEGGWPELVTALDDQVGGVVWSPDGQWLAFGLAPGGGMRQQIFLIRPDGSRLRRLTAGGQDNNWLGEWSDDGRLLPLGSNRRTAAALDAWAWDMER